MIPRSRSLLLTAILLASAFGIHCSSFATDASVTAANVIPSANARTLPGIADVAVTAGQIGYLDTTSGKWKLADCDASALTSGYASSIGMFANSAGAGQAVRVILEDDDLTPGFTLVMSTQVYVLSGTAGGIAPHADLAAGDYPVVLLIAKSTTKCVFRPLRGPAVMVAP